MCVCSHIVISIFLPFTSCFGFSNGGERGGERTDLRANHDFKKPVYVRYGALIGASWFTFIREEILDDAD